MIALRRAVHITVLSWLYLAIFMLCCLIATMVLNNSGTRLAGRTMRAAGQQTRLRDLGITNERLFALAVDRSLPSYRRTESPLPPRAGLGTT